MNDNAIFAKLCRKASEFEEGNRKDALIKAAEEVEKRKMTKIYLAAFETNALGQGYSGYALCEDGVGICSHFSSSISFAKHDLGLTSEWKHEHYQTCCPEGYELEWVDDPDNHPGWLRAVELNHARKEPEA